MKWKKLQLFVIIVIKYKKLQLFEIIVINKKKYNYSEWLQLTSQITTILNNCN